VGGGCELLGVGLNDEHAYLQISLSMAVVVVTWLLGACDSVVVEALCCKPDGRRFETG
jgi:hypothetical protein